MPARSYAFERSAFARSQRVACDPGATGRRRESYLRVARACRFGESSRRMRSSRSNSPAEGSAAGVASHDLIGTPLVHGVD